MKLGQRTLILLGGGVLLLIVLAAVFGQGPELPRADVETVGRHRIVETVIASGRIQPEVMSQEQADYIGVPVHGPFKSDAYRY